MHDSASGPDSGTWKFALRRSGSSRPSCPQSGPVHVESHAGAHLERRRSAPDRLVGSCGISSRADDPTSNRAGVCWRSSTAVPRAASSFWTARTCGHLVVSSEVLAKSGRKEAEEGASCDRGTRAFPTSPRARLEPGKKSRVVGDVHAALQPSKLSGLYQLTIADAADILSLAEQILLSQPPRPQAPCARQHVPSGQANRVAPHSPSSCRIGCSGLHTPLPSAQT